MRNRKILEAVATVTIISTLTRLIAFVFKIFLSRTLGAEVLGIYQIAISIFLLMMSLSASGIPTATSKYIAILEAKKDCRNSRGILTTSLIIASSISIIIIAFGYLFPNVISLLFSDKRSFMMFKIMLPALLSSSIYSVIRSHFWGTKQYLAYSLSEFFEEIISIIIIISTISLHLFGSNLEKNIAYAFLITDYVGCGLLLILFVFTRGKFSRPTMLKPLIKSAVPLTSTRILGSFLSSMMALVIPLMLVSTGMDKSGATANYGRASGMVMPLIFVPSTLASALTVVIVPELASKYAAGHSVNKSISSSLIVGSLISSLFLGIYIAVGDKLCLILYKDTISGSYMSIASYLMPAMAINQMAVSALNTLGHENKTFFVHVVSGIILIILIFVMPKYIGIYAYFTSLIVFHYLSSAIYLAMLVRGNNVSKNELKRLFPPLIMSLLIGYSTKIITRRLNYNIFGLIIICLVISIIYVIFVIKANYLTINIFKKKLLKKTKKYGIN